MIEVMIVVAIIGILLSVALPGWMRQRTVSQARVCQENLRLIEDAKELYALSESLTSGDTVTWDDLYNPTDRSRCFIDNGIPYCPASGDYTINPVGTYPTCSLGDEELLGGSDAAQHRLYFQNTTTTAQN